MTRLISCEKLADRAIPADVSSRLIAKSLPSDVMVKNSAAYDYTATLYRQVRRERPGLDSETLPWRLAFNGVGVHALSPLKYHTSALSLNHLQSEA
jgi:hypothetical protein